LPPNQVIEARFDRLFVSRNAQVTGNVGAHEIAVTPGAPNREGAPGGR
jgi:hypothetical protein